MDTQTSSKFPCTAEEWENLCYQLTESFMAETSLAKLARNIGMKWPIRGGDECPRKYITYSLEELADMPEFFGKGNRLELLYTILREAQGFDDPFRQMVSHLDAVAKSENEALRSLRELEIPADFPVALAGFAPEVQTLCMAEEMATIAQLIDFSQRCAKSVVLGGDFRAFLNALSHLDVGNLRRYLPVREGAKGIHLAESIGLLARQLPDGFAGGLLKMYQLSCDKPAWRDARALNREEMSELVGELKGALEDRFKLMPNQAQQLRHALESGPAAMVRFFAPIGDPAIEDLCQAMTMAALDIKPRGGSLFNRLLNR